MQFDALTNLVIAALVLILMFYFYMAAHLSNLKQEISKKAYLAEVDLIRKNDLLPLFLDKLKEGLSNEERKTLIDWRAKSLQLAYGSIERSELEEMINQGINKIMEKISGQAVLSKNIDFAQFKKNWNEQKVKLLVSENIYKKSADSFNGIIKNPFIFPVKKVMKLSPVK